MKIKISLRELLIQLDAQSPTPNALPHEMILEGTTADANDILEPVFKEFPSVRRLLTASERMIFGELNGSLGQEIRYEVFFRILDRTQDLKNKDVTSRMRNTLAAHVKNIRKKLAQEKLPFGIYTVRDSFKGGGLVLRRLERGFAHLRARKSADLSHRETEDGQSHSEPALQT